MKALIVDGSAIARGIFEKAFKQNGIEVAGAVSNGRKAVDFCRERSVDAVISDCDTGEMDGIEAAKILSKEMGIPVALYHKDMGVRQAALDAGACAFFQKPSLAGLKPETLDDWAKKIKDELLKASAGTKKSAVFEGAGLGGQDSLGDGREFKVLCVGASTGGPTAVQEVLLGLGEHFPLPVLYAQHIDVGSDEKMVKWFNQVCPNIPMSLPKDGEIAEPGHAYMAAADTHLVIDYAKNGLPVLKISDEPPERFLRPAVNKLFRSAAKHYKKSCLAVLLTGMGRDGAEGCKDIVDAGGRTICEDKSTCAVFGMPAAAIELGAASEVLPRNKIADAILRLVKK